MVFRPYHSRPIEIDRQQVNAQDPVIARRLDHIAEQYRAFEQLFQKLEESYPELTQVNGDAERAGEPASDRGEQGTTSSIAQTKSRRSRGHQSRVPKRLTVRGRRSVAGKTRGRVGKGPTSGVSQPSGLPRTARGRRPKPR